MKDQVCTTAFMLVVFRSNLKKEKTQFSHRNQWVLMNSQFALFKFSHLRWYRSWHKWYSTMMSRNIVSNRDVIIHGLKSVFRARGSWAPVQLQPPLFATSSLSALGNVLSVTSITNVENFLKKIIHATLSSRILGNFSNKAVPDQNKLLPFPRVCSERLCILKSKIYAFGRSLDLLWRRYKWWNFYGENIHNIVYNPLEFFSLKVRERRNHNGIKYTYGVLGIFLISQHFTNNETEENCQVL